MNELDPIATFVEAFPRLFHGQQPRVESYLPAGWIPLVTKLLADIDAMLDDTEAQGFEVLQIKEKFGGLRVYWNFGAQTTAVLDIVSPHSAQRVEIRPDQPTSMFDRIAERVRAAESDAAQTCQRCGRRGATMDQSRDWLAALCNACRDLNP